MRRLLRRARVRLMRRMTRSVRLVLKQLERETDLAPF